MVAMVIGLLGIIVMMQMFSVFEGQKRTTTGGDDANSSGAVSLYGVQRSIQQSGWGLSTVPIIGCTATGIWSSVAGAPSIAIPLVPVTINSALITGQDLNTDTLLIVSGNNNGTVEGFNIDSAAGNVYNILFSPTSFSAGPPPDRVVAVPQVRPTPCNLVMTRVTAIAVPPTATVTVADAAGYGAVSTSDKLFNLGPAPTVRAYAIRNQNLTVCDYTLNNCGLVANNGNAAIWVPIANNVVSLRAQYGRDTTTTATGFMDGIVDVWDQTVATTATPISTTLSKNTAACALIRVSAVRIALVARNSQPEKTSDWPALTVHVTPAAPLWSGSDAVAQGIDAAAAAAVAIDLTDVSLSPSLTWPTWQDFRYKVFQTVVPLRNVTSMGVVPEC
jgi:type IV pilus assembly protein PilW